jgi:hypothetical protein
MPHWTKRGRWCLEAAWPSTAPGLRERGAVEGPRLMRVLEGRAETSGRTVQEQKDSALAN